MSTHSRLDEVRLDRSTAIHYPCQTRSGQVQGRNALGDDTGSELAPLGAEGVSSAIPVEVDWPHIGQGDRPRTLAKPLLGPSRATECTKPAQAMTNEFVVFGRGTLMERRDEWVGGVGRWYGRVRCRTFLARHTCIMVAAMAGKSSSVRSDKPGSGSTRRTWLATWLAVKDSPEASARCI
jgi:hypothetical protein